MEKLYVTEKDGRKRLATEIQCDNCDTKFLKANVFIRRTEKRGGKHYCTHECSTTATQNRIKVDCCQCGKSFETKVSRQKKSKSGLLFCSVKCKNIGQRVENCHPDMLPSHFNGGKSIYRETAFRNYPHVCACGDCDFDIVEVLEVHHIDGDRENNNKVENLIILCPTHHKMATMGIATINESREYKIV